MVDWQPYFSATPVPTPAAQADVAKAVEQAKAPLREDVQKLLAERQGQAPEQDVIDIGDDGNTAFGPILVVSDVPSSSTAGTYTVSFAINALKEWSPPADGKPAFFPFASNTSSGWFCVDQRDPAQPIVFIDFNYGPDEQGAITPVAPDVATMLTKLHY